MKKTLLILLCLLFNFYCYSQAPSNGLVAYWSLDGNFIDSGGFGINGINSGTTPTNNVFGVANKAINFNNSTTIVNQYATHTSNANLNFTQAQDFSIDCNVYILGPYIHAGGIYDNGINYGGYGLWFWDTSGFVQINLNFMNGNVGTTNGALNYNTWYHITAVRNGSVLKIYINGVLNVAGNAGTITPDYTSEVATFGSMFFNGISPPRYNGLNGKVDELRIYNRALTDNEILSLYQLTTLEIQNLDIQNNRFTLYPNPSKNSIKISNTSELNGKKFAILDFTGKTVHNGAFTDENSIDVSGLTTGLYLLKVEGSGTTKFIKE
jgi:Concanavalin A-like lectin/glucanases superfamily/Secretion system C-terminal sorting domain